MRFRQLVFSSPQCGPAFNARRRHFAACGSVFKATIAGLLFAVAMGIAAPSNLQAQQEIAESEWKRGFHGFNIICKNVGLIHESREKWLQAPVDQRILVVLGDVNNVGINVDRFIESGGAALIATDGQDSRILRGQGIGFTSRVIKTISRSDYFQFPDCPKVSDTRIHPALKNIHSIITNRPGLITPLSGGSGRPTIIAYLPSLRDSFQNNRFIAAKENPDGGRLLCVSDQSVFANQMLIHGDNALFAFQAMNWLKGENQRGENQRGENQRGQNRTHLLVIADGSVESAVDPSGIEVTLPPPTRQEVLDALKSLPPSAMLEFGNAVATVVEDENMINEFIHTNVDKVRPVVMRRALILMSFAAICSMTIFTYVWQKKLMRQTASVVAFKLRQAISQKRPMGYRR